MEPKKDLISAEELNLLFTIGTLSDFKKAIPKTSKAQAMAMFDHILDNYPLEEDTNWDYYFLINELFKIRSQSFTQKHFTQLFSKTLPLAIKQGPDSKLYFFLHSLTKHPNFQDIEKKLIVKYLSKKNQDFTYQEYPDLVRMNRELIAKKSVTPELFLGLCQIFKKQDLTKLQEHKRIGAFTSFYDGLLALCFYNEPCKKILDDCAKDFLKKISTKFLLYYYKTARNQSYGNYSDDDTNPFQFEKLLKEELDSREHVPSNKDKKIVGLMSKHAGKKLSYDEAIKLKRKLEKKGLVF